MKTADEKNYKRKPRTITSGAKTSKALDVAALVFIAILLAAGFVLNLTVGKALAITGIQPEFIIASYCLAILILKPTLIQSLIIAVLAATVIQITTSIPLLEYLCDIPAAVVMFLFARLLAHKAAAAKQLPFALVPFIATFITTAVSGLIFASVATLFVLKSDPASIIVMLPIVFGTAFANALVVQALYIPLKRAAQR